MTRSARKRAYRVAGLTLTLAFWATVSGLVVGRLWPQQPTATPRQTYVLGPDDQLTMRVLEVDEVTDKPFRIDQDGNINLPMVGPVHAAGMTIHQLETAIVEKFRPYVRQPQVTINITELRSQPVSVIGAVNAPGVHQLQGHKTLIEMLSLAGGLRADAGYRVKITRHMEWGPIPLEGATVDAKGQFCDQGSPYRSAIFTSDP